MSKRTSRRVIRSLNLENLVIDGDLIEKASYIVNQSRSSADPGSRYYSVEDYLERALEKQVKDHESENGEIPLTISGMNGTSTNN